MTIFLTPEDLFWYVVAVIAGVGVGAGVAVFAFNWFRDLL